MFLPPRIFIQWFCTMHKSFVQCLKPKQKFPSEKKTQNQTKNQQNQTKHYFQLYSIMRESAMVLPLPCVWL